MNQDFYYKCNILSLTASVFLILWYFLGINISKIPSLQDFDIQDQQITAYILVSVISLCIIFSLIEYSKIECKSWQSKLQLIIFIALPLISLIISYPKLTETTFLQETNRLDLIIPFLSAIFISIVALQLNVAINATLVFYNFRKTLLPIQITMLVFLCFLVFLGIASINWFGSEGEIPTFPIRYIIFAITFLIFFTILAPKKKIFSNEKLEDLEKLSAFFDREVEVTEYVSSLRKPLSVPKKRVSKKIMTNIKRGYEERRKSTFPRFIMLKQIAFMEEGAHSVPIIEGANDNDPVIRVDWMKKDTQEIIKTDDINFKYVKMACKQVPKLIRGNDIRSFLNSMAFKAHSLHVIHENDPNELMFNYALSDENINNLKELFKNRNPTINYVAPNGWSALLVSVANGAEKNAKYLLQKAADPSISTKYGATPLHFAAKYGKLSLCKLLINYKADINQRDVYGRTALMLASKLGHTSIVKLLIQSGADSQLIDDDKKSAFNYAAEGNYGEICKLLK